MAVIYKLKTRTMPITNIKIRVSFHEYKRLPKNDFYYNRFIECFWYLGYLYSQTLALYFHVYLVSQEICAKILFTQNFKIFNYG